jgi:glycosyltransferase involved in cell wall biosynthesis
MKAKIPIKVCHCSILHRLDDSRIFYKECISLAKAGYSVTFIARPAINRDFDEPSYLGVNLYKLIKNTRIYNHFYLLAIILKKRVNVVHFHDPELILMGVFLRLLGKIVIYDVHENVRQDIYHKKWINQAIIPCLAQIVIFFEFIAGSCFNSVICATPAIAKNFNCKYNYVISNFPPLQNCDLFFKAKRNTNTIIYVGLLSESRGIKGLIEAAGYLIGEAKLVLIGAWSDEIFKLECEKMIGFKNINYIGIVSHELINSYLTKAAIGLCMLHPIDTYKESYPIKVFEYMQSGLPVLMSNFGMWNELFGDVCEYTDPMNPSVMAEKIKSMLSNSSRLVEMSEKGAICIQEKFNWDSEAKKLNELYTQLCG